MCGILFVDCKKGTSCVKPLLKRYRKQDHRGQTGYGYVSINNEGFVSEVRRSVDEDGIVAALANENASKIMMHHRAATSLPNYVGATHPFYITHPDFKYDYYIQHNGVITNHEFVWKEYLKLGFVFLTTMIEGKYREFIHTNEGYEEQIGDAKINDSEAFAVDLCSFIEGKTEWIKSSGTIAFIGLQVEKEGDKKGKVKAIIYGHNEGNPVLLEEDKTMFSLTSEAGGQEIPVDTIFFREWDTNKTTEIEAKGLAYHGWTRNVSARENMKLTKSEKRAKRKADAIARQAGALENNDVNYGQPDDSDDDPQIDDAIARLTGGKRLEEHKDNAPLWWENGQPITKGNLRERNDSIMSRMWNAITPAGRQDPETLMNADGLTPEQRHYSEILLDVPPRPARQPSVFDGDVESELTLMDIGFDAQVIMDEIAAAGAGNSDADAEVLRELRDEVEELLDEENDALKQLRAAQNLLREAAHNQPYNQVEADEARAMVDAASDEYSSAKHKRNATAAELEYHLQEAGIWK